MNDSVINELNTLLKGEEMAVNAYDHYIRDVRDEEVKNSFRQFQNDHKRHAENIAKRIEILGGQPKHGTGIAGTMASAKTTVGHIINGDAVHILEEAYNGEDKGIGMAEEVVKGDLDAESAKLVDSILSEDHNHLVTMAKMIGKHQEKH